MRRVGVVSLACIHACTHDTLASVHSAPVRVRVHVHVHVVARCARRYLMYHAPPCAPVCALTPRLCMRCVCAACAAGQCNVSLPPRKHTGGHARAPPGGAGVGRGGWHGVARAWDSYIYLNLYTFIYIANSSNLHMEMINVDKNKD